MFRRFFLLTKCFRFGNKGHRIRMEDDMGTNLPPGCTQADIDRAFGSDEPEDEFACAACEDTGWLDDNGHAVPCTECSQEISQSDLDDVPAMFAWGHGTDRGNR